MVQRENQCLYFYVLVEGSGENTSKHSHDTLRKQQADEPKRGLSHQENLATKSDDLSSILGTPRVGRKELTPSCKLSPDRLIHKSDSSPHPQVGKRGRKNKK